MAHQTRLYRRTLSRCLTSYAGATCISTHIYGIAIKTPRISISIGIALAMTISERFLGKLLIAIGGSFAVVALLLRTAGLFYRGKQFLFGGALLLGLVQVSGILLERLVVLTRTCFLQIHGLLVR